MRTDAVRLIAIATLAVVASAACGAAAPAVPSVAPTPVAPPSLSTTPPQGITEFDRTVSGSMPTGWTDEGGVISKSENLYIEVLTDRSVMAADCVLGPEPGVGRSSGDVVAALAGRDGLVATGQSPVTVGGLTGRQLDIAIAPGWTADCPWWEGESAMVPLVGTFDDKNLWLFNAVTAGEQYRYLVLDTPGGGNVLVAITALEPQRLDAQTLAESMAIVGRLEFAVPS